MQKPLFTWNFARQSRNFRIFFSQQPVSMFLFQYRMPIAFQLKKWGIGGRYSSTAFGLQTYVCHKRIAFCFSWSRVPNNQLTLSTFKRNKSYVYGRRKKKMASTTTMQETVDVEPVVKEISDLSLHDVLDGGKSRSNGKSPSSKKHKEKPEFPKIPFETYWSHNRVSAALKRKEVVEGFIRINARNFEIAYVTPPEENGDILVKGVKFRNRSLHGDKVVVQLLPQHKWKTAGTTVTSKNSDEKNTEPGSSNHLLVKTGKVVFISEEKNPRIAAGHLKPYKNNYFGCALFSPLDSKLPRLYIPSAECPSGFDKRPQDFQTTLFIASIQDWRENFGLATGKLMRSLGEAGEIEAETQAMLLENGVIDGPFSSNVLDCLPQNLPWVIPPQEFKSRLDLRKDCIFTIDPLTARDLDDALSIEKLESGNFKVGVHIADVSFFVTEDTALDKAAKLRGTSVYLVQKVVPMLPRLLCEELCSLNPGVDRLTFSVVWTITPDGDIVDEWFGKSVISSCSKLAYTHAQQIIESSSTDSLDQIQFPSIFGDHTLNDIYNKVKQLWRIAEKLRNRRFSNGALRLDQPKISFTINNDTGLPSGISAYEYKESNMMIEEFMLLANMAVAHKILKSNHNLAILRRHPKPDQKVLEEIATICSQQNIPFDCNDSSSIQRSIDMIRSQPPEGLNKDSVLAIISLASKSMKLAKYFCAGVLSDEELYRHYALNVPLYTHFTSPIRRYPDVLVHRLLQAALDCSSKLNKAENEMQEIAEHCNDKKLSAKKVQELSSELFFLIYVQECGPLIDNGSVVGILDNSIDVISHRFGVIKRVYCNNLPLISKKYSVLDGQSQLKLQWRTPGVDENNALSDNGVVQVLKHLSSVKIIIKADKMDKKKLFCTLERPDLV